MADLTALQTELETAIEQLREAEDAKIQAERTAAEEARLAAEAAKTDEDKAAEIQAAIDHVRAKIAELEG
jgi:hypothetical protein